MHCIDKDIIHSDAIHIAILQELRDNKFQYTMQCWIQTSMRMTNNEVGELAP